MRRRTPRDQNPFPAWLESLGCDDPEWKRLAEGAELFDEGTGAEVGRACLAWPGRACWLAESGAFRWTLL